MRVHVCHVNMANRFAGYAEALSIKKNILQNLLKMQINKYNKCI